MNVNSKIVSIKPVGIRDVWDIEVEQDHSYSAHGFINHNSSKPINLMNQPRDKGMIRKAFVAKLPGDAESDLVLIDGDYCLTGDTKVETLLGSKSISDLLIGEKLFCYKKSEGKPWLCEVEAKVCTKEQEVWEVILDNGQIIRGSGHHLLYLRDGSMKELSDLVYGEILLPVKEATVKVILVRNTEIKEIMYDIQVSGDHNFALTAGVISSNSQIELRLAAHLANEPSLLEVYNSGSNCTCDQFLQGHECKDKFGKKCKWLGLVKAEAIKICPECGSGLEWLSRCRHVDVHQRTSEDVNVPRNPLAKNLNFGTLYKIGPAKFAIYADIFDEAGHPRVDYARELISKWMDTYWRIPEWHWEEENRLKANNWIAYTLTGRRRRLDEERKFNEYSAITQAINFRVQGCQIGSSKILTDIGYIPIALLSGERIFDGISFTSDYSVLSTGKKVCYEVVLEDGRSITCSSDHRFATMNGLEMKWKQLKNLSNGDFIATMNPHITGGYECMTKDEGYLIGLLIGDGYYRSDRGFTIACQAEDRRWCNTVKKAIKCVFDIHVGERTNFSNRGGHTTSYVVTSKPSRLRLSTLGLEYVSKLDKRIPNSIFTASLDVRANILSGLFDSDGHVRIASSGRDGTISFSNRVKDMAYGVHYLLLSLGISSTIKAYKDNCEIIVDGNVTYETRLQYRVRVIKRDFAKFLSLIPLRHHRKKRLAEKLVGLTSNQEEPSRNLPPSFVKEVARIAVDSVALTKRSSICKANSDAKTRRLVQALIAKALKGEGGDRSIRKVTDYIGIKGHFDDILSLGWQRIKSITEVGDHETFDIEIYSKHHAYISNGVLTHNSAQDIIKVGMIRVYEEREKLIANSLPEARKMWQRLKFLIQVHDEIVMECPESIKEEAKLMIKGKMEGAARLKCPLIFSIKAGINWEECH